jgi:tRNA (cmo5U34)-methyltransferase
MNKNPARQKRDTLFASTKQVQQFEFNSDVASVFDDMISRSVPLYGEVQTLCGLLCAKICTPGACVVDLGCSTGTTILEIFRALAPQKVRFIGVDNSPAMLDVCRQKLKQQQVFPEPILVCANLDQYVISGADVVLLNYTLQFVPPAERLIILSRIYEGLQPGGYLILSEKVCHSDTGNQSLLTDLHHDFKRSNGYSELEIARKRDSLENILIPLTLEENISLLQSAGFTAIDVVNKAFTFTTLIARRDSD